MKDLKLTLDYSPVNSSELVQLGEQYADCSQSIYNSLSLLNALPHYARIKQ